MSDGSARPRIIRDAQTTYRIMSSIKSRDTAPERILGKALWRLGLRYRKHFHINGKPDFAFTKAKIAVFCDGDFWHGNNWRLRGLSSFESELATYSPFWSEKLKRNVDRDQRVTRDLENDGWHVMRFWESDIRSNPEECAFLVLQTYQTRRHST